MSNIEIEHRLAAIESELASLKAKSATASHPINALEKIHCTFENDRAFKDAMRLGRKWRHADRRSSRKAKARRK